MDIIYWIRWKLRELKKLFVKYVINRYLWKKLWVGESEKGHWEILNDTNGKTIQLHYVPEEDYSEKDIKINLSYEEFQDLNDFMNKIR